MDFIATQQLQTSFGGDVTDEQDDQDQPRTQVGSLTRLKTRGLAKVVYPIWPGENVIGRSLGDCNIRLDFKTVSLRHATIEVIGDDHVIMDLKSTNKTYRGKLVLRPEVRYALEEGAQITFADVECRYSKRIVDVSDSDSDLDCASTQPIEANTSALSGTAGAIPVATSSAVANTSTLCGPSGLAGPSGGRTINPGPSVPPISDPSSLPVLLQEYRLRSPPLVTVDSSFLAPSPVKISAAQPTSSTSGGVAAAVAISSDDVATASKDVCIVLQSDSEQSDADDIQCVSASFIDTSIIPETPALDHQRTSRNVHSGNAIPGSGITFVNETLNSLASDSETDIDDDETNVVAGTAAISVETTIPTTSMESSTATIAITTADESTTAIASTSLCQPTEDVARKVISIETTILSASESDDDIIADDKSPKTKAVEPVSIFDEVTQNYEEVNNENAIFDAETEQYPEKRVSNDLFDAPTQLYELNTIPDVPGVNAEKVASKNDSDLHVILNAPTQVFTDETKIVSNSADEKQEKIVAAGVTIDTSDKDKNDADEEPFINTAPVIDPSEKVNTNDVVTDPGRNPSPGEDHTTKDPEKSDVKENRSNAVADVTTTSQLNESNAVGHESAEPSTSVVDRIPLANNGVNLEEVLNAPTQMFVPPANNDSGDKSDEPAQPENSSAAEPSDAEMNNVNLEEVLNAPTQMFVPPENNDSSDESDEPAQPVSSSAAEPSDAEAHNVTMDDVLNAQTQMFVPPENNDSDESDVPSQPESSQDLKPTDADTNNVTLEDVLNASTQMFVLPENNDSDVESDEPTEPASSSGFVPNNVEINKDVMKDYLNAPTQPYVEPEATATAPADDSNVNLAEASTLPIDELSGFNESRDSSQDFVSSCTDDESRKLKKSIQDVIRSKLLMNTPDKAERTPRNVAEEAEKPSTSASTSRADETPSTKGTVRKTTRNQSPKSGDGVVPSSPSPKVASFFPPLVSLNANLMQSPKTYGRTGRRLKSDPPLTPSESDSQNSSESPPSLRKRKMTPLRRSNDRSVDNNSTSDGAAERKSSPNPVIVLDEKITARNSKVATAAAAEPVIEGAAQKSTRPTLTRFGRRRENAAAKPAAEQKTTPKKIAPGNKSRKAAQVPDDSDSDDEVQFHPKFHLSARSGRKKYNFQTEVATVQQEKRGTRSGKSAKIVSPSSGDDTDVDVASTSVDQSNRPTTRRTNSQVATMPTGKRESSVSESDTGSRNAKLAKKASDDSQPDVAPAKVERASKSSSQRATPQEQATVSTFGATNKQIPSVVEKMRLLVQRKINLADQLSEGAESGNSSSGGSHATPPILKRVNLCRVANNNNARTDLKEQVEKAAIDKPVNAIVARMSNRIRTKLSTGADSQHSSNDDDDVFAANASNKSSVQSAVKNADEHLARKAVPQQSNVAALRTSGRNRTKSLTGGDSQQSSNGDDELVVNTPKKASKEVAVKGAAAKNVAGSPDVSATRTSARTRFSKGESQQSLDSSNDETIETNSNAKKTSSAGATAKNAPAKTVSTVVDVIQRKSSRNRSTNNGGDSQQSNSDASESAVETNPNVASKSSQNASTHKTPPRATTTASRAEMTNSTKKGRPSNVSNGVDSTTKNKTRDNSQSESQDSDSSPLGQRKTKTAGISKMSEWTSMLKPKSVARESLNATAAAVASVSAAAAVNVSDRRTSGSDSSNGAKDRRNKKHSIEHSDAAKDTDSDVPNKRKSSRSTVDSRSTPPAATRIGSPTTASKRGGGVSSIETDAKDDNDVTSKRKLSRSTVDSRVPSTAAKIGSPSSAAKISSSPTVNKKGGAVASIEIGQAQPVTQTPRKRGRPPKKVPNAGTVVDPPTSPDATKRGNANANNSPRQLKRGAINTVDEKTPLEVSPAKKIRMSRSPAAGKLANKAADTEPASPTSSRIGRKTAKDVSSPKAKQKAVVAEAANNNNDDGSEDSDFVVEKKGRGQRNVTQRAKTPVSITSPRASKSSSPSSAVNSPSKRKRSAPGTPRTPVSSAPTTSKKALSPIVLPKPVIMFTGFKDSSSSEEIVRSLGGQVTDVAKVCTHLVTDKVRRTCKFLCCVSLGVPIVSMEWLKRCRIAKSFIDPQPFMIKDEEQESLHNFVLTTSLRSALLKPFLKDYEVHTTPKVKPCPEEMQPIIECAGGTVLPRLPNKQKADGKIVVVSCPEDKKYWKSTTGAGIPVVSAEFILKGALRQKVQTELFLLDTAGPAAPGSPATKRSKVEQPKRPGRPSTKR